MRIGVTAAVRFGLASLGAASRLKSSLDARSVAIDILLNNAGYALQGDFLETPNRSHGEHDPSPGLPDRSQLREAYAATKAYVLALGEACMTKSARMAWP